MIWPERSRSLAGRMIFRFASRKSYRSRLYCFHSERRIIDRICLSKSCRPALGAVETTMQISVGVQYEPVLSAQVPVVQSRRAPSSGL